MTLEEKDFFPIFRQKNIFYRDSFIREHVTRLTPLGTHFNTPPEGGVLCPCVATHFLGGVCVPCVVALDLPSIHLFSPSPVPVLCSRHDASVI